MKKKSKRNTKSTVPVVTKPEPVVPETVLGPDFGHPRLIGKLLGRAFNHVKLTDGSYVLLLAPR